MTRISVDNVYALVTGIVALLPSEAGQATLTALPVEMLNSTLTLTPT